MKSIDINQMQFKELAKTISKSSGRKGLHLEDNDLKFLISKTNEFLAGLKRIVITDRKHVSNDGYFVLDISTKGIRLLKSRSVSRYEYLFVFETNEFKLNDRAIDVSFLDQFLVFIDHISNELPSGKYEVIEER